jgi:hypothetical protein
MKRLFFNPRGMHNAKVSSAYHAQREQCKEIWEGSAFGVERLLQLFLCLLQFVFPLLFIKEVFGRRGSVARKLAVEFYGFLKVIFPLYVLVSGLYRIPAFVYIAVYFLSETILHIVSLVFLADIKELALSSSRALLLLCMHYSEVILDFSVLYIGFNLLSEALTPVSAVYFSVVAATTVGFGDIHAKGGAGQLAVIAQLLICLLFIMVFFNYFSRKD